MADVKESTIERSIRRWIDDQPACRTLKVHGGGRGRNGVPDIVACIGGIMVLLEVKRPGERSRPLQVHEQRQWAEAGAVVAEVHSRAEAVAVVVEILAGLDCGDMRERLHAMRSRAISALE